MLSSPIVEQKVLAGCLQHQEDFALIDNQIAERDFDVEASKVHVTIFKLIRHAARNKEIVDENILISRLRDLGVTFEDNIDAAEYIRNLAFRKITKEVWKTAIDELKKFSARRELVDTMRREISFLERGVDPSVPLPEIISRIDRNLNEAIQEVTFTDENVETNLFATIDEDMEYIVNNFKEEDIGPEGPYPLLHKMYGSLFRPGNITFLVARAKVGKTTFALDYSIRTAMKNKIPIIHFDNGEMSAEELKFRICAALTNLPITFFERGTWGTIPSYKGESGDKLRARVKKTLKEWRDSVQFHYYSIAGMSGEEVSNLLKRVYYTKIGRGNRCGLSLDYVKLDFSSGDTQNQWVSVAKFIDKIKQTVQKEIVVDGKPVIGVFTSVQANRSGITRGKKIDELKEDESIVSMTDAIAHFCSHLFLFRNMVEEELIEYGEDFGTHILKNILARHLGVDAEKARKKIDFRNGKWDNFLLYNIENFGIEERGDLYDIVEVQKCKEQLKEETTESRIPKQFEL